MNELLDKLKEQQSTRPDDAHTTRQVPDDLTIPDTLPEVGSFIRFVYGDPNMVGGDPVIMPAVVTSFRLDGLVCGHAFLDPLMQAMGQDGRPVQLPATMPVGNVPYDPKGTKLSWHWAGDIATPVPQADPAEDDNVIDIKL